MWCPPVASSEQFTDKMRTCQMSVTCQSTRQVLAWDHAFAKQLSATSIKSETRAVQHPFRAREPDIRVREEIAFQALREESRSSNRTPHADPDRPSFRRSAMA